MSEELLQTAPKPLGRYLFYRLGGSTLRQLRNAGVVKGSFTQNIANKKPDGIVVLLGGGVKAIIEYKSPSELRTPELVQIAIDQELEVARQLCKLLIVTSGNTTYRVNALTGNWIRTEEGNVLTRIFDVRPIEDGSISAEAATDLELLIDKIDHSLSDTNDQLSMPEVLDPSALAKTMWQKIWVNTGKEPEKCLYNVVELFVFKFLSDIGVLQSHNNFNSVCERLHDVSAAAALTYYANICRKEVQVLFPKSDDGTTIINGTIFVNENGQPNTAQANLFGEVLRHLQDYDSRFGSLRYINKEFKTRLYEAFLRQNAGIKFLGQYFTPRNVVRAMVEMSDAKQLRDGARICDPFCGVGGFILECISANPHILRGFEPVDGVVAPSITMVGYDKGSDEKEDERTIILAKANMLIYLSDLLTKYHSPEHLQAFSTGALNNVFRLLRSNLGTFARVNDAPYDLILTNPPYVTSGSRSLRHAIEEQGLSGPYTIGGHGTEVLAIEWVVRQLRQKGQALVVVPDGLMGQGLALAYLKRHCTVEAVVSLPTRTFYSTPRKTYILSLRKKAGTNSVQTTPVFAYLVSEIGETRDANRFQIEENNLPDTVSLFNQFKGAPTAFTSADPRFKMLPFGEFDAMSHWMIDRLWTQQEKVELGITEDTVEVSEQEYAKELSNISKLIVDFTAHPDVPAEPEATQQMVSLGDPALFEFIPTKTTWTKLTLRDLDTNDESDVPVYSASAKPIAHVGVTNDKLIECSTEDPLISFASNGDGSAGRNFVVHERPFYVSNDRTVIRVLCDEIIPAFLLYKLQSMKEEYGFGFAYKATPPNLREVSFDIPTEDAGGFDPGRQKAIVEKYRAIEKLQKDLVSQVEALASSRIVLD